MGSLSINSSYGYLYFRVNIILSLNPTYCRILAFWVCFLCLISFRSFVDSCYYKVKYKESKVTAKFVKFSLVFLNFLWTPGEILSSFLMYVNKFVSQSGISWKRERNQKGNMYYKGVAFCQSKHSIIFLSLSSFLSEKYNT